MKYVALLSGGKDSCFSLLHCSQNGHELIAAASLGPERGKEELDSYLYQTVGQDAIEFIARALEVPLYRKIIFGDAVEQGCQYGSRNAMDIGVQGDETEDLFVLLSTVKSHHPDVQGVSVGTILSNYQRVRVEHVEQSELLSEMIEAGMQSILIKVAGIGLTKNHLGKNLVDMRPILLKLNQLYGSHVCGEGGEYETLTLDCPLFKHRVTLLETEQVVLSSSDLAPVAYLRIKAATLTLKDEIPILNASIPSLLDTDSVAVHDTVIESQRNLLSSPQYSEISPIHQTEPWSKCISSRNLDPWVAIANVQMQVSDITREISVEEEVKECFRELQKILAIYSLNLAHCSHINLFLSSMDLFHRVNAVYATYFGTNPPSRACVAVDLVPPTRVKLDCIAYADDRPSERQALHVQGLSYWAPANIGPYSQAIMVDERIFLSGQIGLVPASLTLPSPPSLAVETALSFQHVKRVIDVLRNNSGGSWLGHNQTNLYWLTNVGDLPHVKRACKEHDNAFVPTLFLLVKGLPKDALVEKQAILHTGRRFVNDDDDEPSPQFRAPVVDRGEISENGLVVYWEVSQFEDSGSSCAIVCVRVEASNAYDLSSLRSIFSRFQSCCLSIRLFYQHSRQLSLVPMIEASFGPELCPPITSIPCRLISTMERDNWDYAMYILRVGQ